MDAAVGAATARPIEHKGHTHFTRLGQGHGPHAHPDVRNLPLMMVDKHLLAVDADPSKPGSGITEVDAA